jgi:hypothetical protein
MAMPKPFDLQREIESLRRVRNEKAEEIQRLRQEIRELRRRQGETTPNRDGPMRGLKLVVIGLSFRCQDYLVVLEPMGARVLVFASEDKIGQIPRHEIDDRVDPTVDRLGIPITKLPFKGLDRLRETALAMEISMKPKLLGHFIAGDLLHRSGSVWHTIAMGPSIRR